MTHRLLLVVCGATVGELERTALPALVATEQHQDDSQDESGTRETAHNAAHNLSRVKRRRATGVRVAGNRGIRTSRGCCCRITADPVPARATTSIEGRRPSSVERLCWRNAIGGCGG